MIRRVLLHRACWAAMVSVPLWSGPACERNDGPRVGSNSNWLSPCAVDDDCAPYDCRCGVCTPVCSGDEDCADLDDGVCAQPDQPATWAQCETQDVARGICLASCQPGDCPQELMCVGTRCVYAPLPSSEFCSPVADADGATRQREEQLLELLQEARRTGATACGASSSQVVPELRLDSGMRCAARVLAADLYISRGDTVIDSAGRETPERLALAGYAAQQWGEAFAYARDASGAFEIMTGGEQSCLLLFDPFATDVGVGCVGDVCVLTLASPAP